MSIGSVMHCSSKAFQNRSFLSPQNIIPLWNKLPDYAISAANFDLFNQYLNCII